MCFSCLIMCFVLNCVCVFCVTYRVDVCEVLSLCEFDLVVWFVCALVCDGVWFVCASVCFLV